MADELVGLADTRVDGRRGLLSVDRLRVVVTGSETDVVDDVSFAVGSGEVPEPTVPAAELRPPR